MTEINFLLTCCGGSGGWCAVGCEVCQRLARSVHLRQPSAMAFRTSRPCDMILVTIVSKSRPLGSSCNSLPQTSLRVRRRRLSQAKLTALSMGSESGLSGSYYGAPAHEFQVARFPYGVLSGICSAAHQAGRASGHAAEIENS